LAIMTDGLENLSFDKKAVRAAMRAARVALTASEREAETKKVAEAIMGLDVWKKASTLVAYMAHGSELDLSPVMASALKEGKKLALPVVAGKELVFRLVPDLGEENFHLGAFGISEPKDDLSEWTPYLGGETLWLIPGVAFDRNCQRLGQGGGFYDRTLAKLHSCRPVGQTFAGAAFDCQIADFLPLDEWDRPLDLVITPGNIYINSNI